MVYCERCGSKFHSERAARLDLCPRCLVRDDVASHLQHGGFPSPPPAPDAPLFDREVAAGLVYPKVKISGSGSGY